MYWLSGISRVEGWFSNVSANTAVAIFRMNIYGGGGGYEAFINIWQWELSE
jgi:hypothetical protein